METTLSEPFSKWLESKCKDVSMRLLAERTGVDCGTISRTVRGKTEISLTTAFRLCRGLGLSAPAFFVDWQKKTLPGQQPECFGERSLTRRDIQRWLECILEGQQRTREFLLAALNLIMLKEGRCVIPPSRCVQPFGMADMEKLLWDLPCFRFELLPPLQHDAIMASIGDIYRQGGVLLPSEIGAYVRSQRTCKGLSFKQLATQSDLPVSLLESIEQEGLVRRIKLCEVLRLDAGLQREGELFAMCWWELAERSAFECAWVDSACADHTRSLPLRHALVSLLVGVGRWLQYIYRDDVTWLAALRHELGLFAPATGPSLMNASAEQGSSADLQREGELPRRKSTSRLGRMACQARSGG